MGNAAAKTLEAIEEEPSNPETPSSSSSSVVEAETKTHEDKKPEVLDQSSDVCANNREEVVEEEECRFRVFMKEGECRESFIAWQKCAEEGEKNNEDIAEKCSEITGLLTKCMDVHADYYEPILIIIEKAMEELEEREAESEESILLIIAEKAMEEFEREAESKEKKQEAAEADKELEREAESKEKQEN